MWLLWNNMNSCVQITAGYYTLYMASILPGIYRIWVNQNHTVNYIWQYSARNGSLWVLVDKYCKSRTISYRYEFPKATCIIASFIIHEVSLSICIQTLMSLPNVTCRLQLCTESIQVLDTLFLLMSGVMTLFTFYINISGQYNSPLSIYKFL
jgi:hypothetical protein